MKTRHITETDSARARARPTLEDRLCDAHAVDLASCSIAVGGGTKRACPAPGRGGVDAPPPRYARRMATVAGTPGAGTTIYTCPMHPEVRQGAPGKCPKCGMFLQPLASGAQMKRAAAATSAVPAIPAPARYSAGCAGA